MQIGDHLNRVFEHWNCHWNSYSKNKFHFMFQSTFFYQLKPTIFWQATLASTIQSSWRKHFLLLLCWKWQSWGTVKLLALNFSSLKKYFRKCFYSNIFSLLIHKYGATVCEWPLQFVEWPNLHQLSILIKSLLSSIFVILSLG